MEQIIRHINLEAFDTAFLDLILTSAKCTFVSSLKFVIFLHSTLLKQTHSEVASKQNLEKSCRFTCISFQHFFKLSFDDMILCTVRIEAMYDNAHFFTLLWLLLRVRVYTSRHYCKAKFPSRHSGIWCTVKKMTQTRHCFSTLGHIYTYNLNTCTDTNTCLHECQSCCTIAGRKGNRWCCFLAVQTILMSFSYIFNNCKCAPSSCIDRLRLCTCKPGHRLISCVDTHILAHMYKGLVTIRLDIMAAKLMSSFSSRPIGINQCDREDMYLAV